MENFSEVEWWLNIIQVFLKYFSFLPAFSWWYIAHVMLISFWWSKKNLHYENRCDLRLNLGSEHHQLCHGMPSTFVIIKCPIKSTYIMKSTILRPNIQIIFCVFLLYLCNSKTSRGRFSNVFVDSLVYIPAGWYSDVHTCVFMKSRGNARLRKPTRRK